MNKQPPNAMRLVVLICAIIGMALSAARVTAEVFQLMGDEYMEWADQTSGQPRLDFWTKAMTFYLNASHLEPWQSQHEYKLGQAYVTWAENSPPSTDEARSAWSHASDSFSQAVNWDPANGR